MAQPAKLNFLLFQSRFGPCRNRTAHKHGVEAPVRGIEDTGLVWVGEHDHETASCPGGTLIFFSLVTP